MILNIAAYQFTRLEGLKALRERLISKCKEWGLKGTILLSTEGINLFVAGAEAGVELLLHELRSLPGLENLTPKRSESEEQPFSRMLVRIKKEIISFGVEGIDPATRTSPKLPARTLKQWLDEGRPVTLLDTRNDYEVKLGTFKGAMVLPIDHFRQFPQAVRELPESLKETPIVMFCTGGIRCEKAGPFMEREGFNQIFQLDGGILKYFEECGGEHYQGECFVFDQRVGVDPALKETDSSQCFACQAPLDAEDLKDHRFVAGRCCPYCYKTPEEQQAELLLARNEALRQVTQPLPGSVPARNRRPLCVPGEYDQRSLLDCLCGVFPQNSRERWAEELERGVFRDERDVIAPAHRTVRGGERLYRVEEEQVEPDVNAAIQILFEDEAIIVLNKPAPLPMHPSGRFHRNTLQFILNQVYAPFHPHPAHRLDSNTTGVLVCTRTRKFARLVQPQFAKGDVEKVYLARVVGYPEAAHFVCEAPIGSEPRAFGSRVVDELEGQACRTEFSMKQRFEDGTTLLEVRPKTGRTNQIRLHLQQLGFPICGDPVYRLDGSSPEAMTLPLGAPPLCLHAFSISFAHPLTNQAVTFSVPAPSWAEGHPVV